MNKDEISEIILCMCTDGCFAGNCISDGLFDGESDYSIIEYFVSVDDCYDLCERSTVSGLGYVGSTVDPVGIFDVNGLVFHGVKQCGMGDDGSYPGRQL